ncbi:DUF3575 domain-containing protein [Winogradskyella sediminis]|uniref:DUF3575 domain-containing protein n=1 Tax=Winogradskyella sediminis TaxID=1382466 RepID=UPI000E23C305|nr:DUF3575 domain-containing protein [Winogradskyella sediminis]REG89688.1 uncharacterized protein DUF3575 [Winogradskyella sediminis]
MKSFLFALFLLCSILNLSAQQQNDSIAALYKKQNEVKLNAVMLLAGAFEASYERNLNEESSLGVSFFTPYDNENLDANINYYISPYYRIFFGKKYAAGFFVEGFAMLNSIDREYGVQDSGGFYTYEEESVTDFALGFGLGGKWVSKNGFVFELTGGIGRNLFQNDYDTTIVGKFGFNLGYRF